MMSHVIHVQFDAIAAGYLGFMGNEWVETPSFDRLAFESVIFDHAYSSLDLFPELQGPGPIIADAGDRSAEGIRTILIMDPVRPESKTFLTGARRHGVETPTVRSDQRPSPDRLFESALEWLRANPQTPAIVWIDLRLTKVDWSPSADQCQKHLEDREPFDPTGSFAGLVGQDLSVEDLDRARETYAARIEELDASFGRFHQKLEQLPGWDETLFSLSADQGWPLGEHEAVGLIGHELHEERDHVPLVVRWPGAQPGRSPALVSPTDCAGMFEEFLERPSTDQSSLAPIIAGQAFALREALIAKLGNEEYAIRTSSWKLILPATWPSSERPRQLYAKPEDRWEVNDLAEIKELIADHLELHLRRYLHAAERPEIESLPPMRRDLLADA